MRTNRQGGFTLIELLIVIAIIGILAAVLIPNLLSARRAAQDRAAQAHSQQIFTAVNAVLSEDIKAALGGGTGLNPVQFDHDNSGTPADVATGQDCQLGGTFSSAGSGEYEVSNPGAAVATCDIVFDSDELYVQVTSINHVASTNVRLFENGQPVDQFTTPQ